MGYLFFKAIHIIAVISWMAGIFYIWRIFVYHSESDSPETKKTLSIMAEKLYRIIINPAMKVSVSFGVILFYLQWNSFSSSIWIWAKIGFVILMIGNQHMANFYRKKLDKGEKFNSKKFRILNEVPTVLMIAIVFLVIFKSC
jgi:protoporphyrinogen IX oxidase